MALEINKYQFTVQLHEFLLSTHSLRLSAIRPITKGFFYFLPDFPADVLDEDAFRFTAHFDIFTGNIPNTWT